MPQEKVRRAAFVAVGLALSPFALLTHAAAAEAPCPAPVPSLSRAAPLRDLGQDVQARTPIRIVAIGSSSTQGIGASSKALAYPAQLEGYLKRLWKLDSVRVENAGIGGEVAAQTISRLETALRTKPDLVIWQVGTNDALAGGDESQFRALLERGIAAARAAKVEIVLLDQQFYPGIRDLGRYERFVGLVGEVARRAGVSVFSRFTLMKGWAAQSATELRTMLAADGFHMSDRGYTCLTRSLGHSLASLIPAAPEVAAR